MKLATHYNKASIIISVAVLLISAVVYYFAINSIARNQLDDSLTEEIAEVKGYVDLNGHFPKQVDFDEDQTTILKTKQTSFSTHFFDTVYKDLKDKKTEPGRAVETLMKLNGENYIVKIVVSRESTEYLIQMIFIITLILSFISLSTLLITNKYVLNDLWCPFYSILSHVKKFNVADTQKMETVESRVDEFQELSNAVSTMSSRVTKDYQGLKAFTENASHEMMTPIAVITSKLDTLIQDERLISDQLSQITDIYSATSKLSRLNQSLLLLVKIENGLIQEDGPVNLKLVILEKVQQFQELVQGKKIEVTTNLADFEVTASKYLIDILINNLFSNAIRHNKTPGIIKINLLENILTFQNSGSENPLEQEQVFNRFYKGKSSEGTGLGLAIIKNICNKYQHKIEYLYIDGLHSFTVNF